MRLHPRLPGGEYAWPSDVARAADAAAESARECRLERGVHGAGHGRPGADVPVARFNETNLPPGATNSALILTHVQDGDAGGYSVVVDNGVAVASSNALLTVNHLPEPAAPVLERFASSGVKVRAVSLLGTDADGDRLSLSSAGPSSAQGGLVRLNGDWVFYTPPSGYGGDDSFPFTVSDGRGGISPGTGQIRVSSGLAQSLDFRLEPAGPDAVWIVGDGVPGRTYAVEFATNLASPTWQRLGLVGADDLGMFDYLDAPPTGRAPAILPCN